MSIRSRVPPPRSLARPAGKVAVIAVVADRSLEAPWPNATVAECADVALLGRAPPGSYGTTGGMAPQRRTPLIDCPMRNDQRDGHQADHLGREATSGTDPQRLLAPTRQSPTNATISARSARPVRCRGTASSS